MELDQVLDWLWCLRTPIVQAYAVRERDGFNLIDASTADQDVAILETLAGIDGRTIDDVRIHELLLTHAHEDHTGSAAALAARTGAGVIASRDEAPVMTGERPAPAPVLADWEVPLFEQVAPNVPPARQLARLDARVACFGHGEPLRSDAATRLAEALSRACRRERNLTASSIPCARVLRVP